MGKIKDNALKIAVGAAVGAVNGLLGGGGGMLCVPFLEKILGENVKVSHATTVLVIFPVCAVAAAIYAAGGSADMPETLFVMAGGAAGGAFGSIALKAAAPKAVAVIFAVIVAAAGVCMICGR